MRQDLKALYADERLPRYTSDPASPHFTGAVGPAAYAEWLRALAVEAKASLYLRVPFCRSL